MSLVIRLNSFDLNDRTKYSVTGLNHEQIPSINNNILKVSARDGAKFISQLYEPKEISIEGYITGTSQADIEQNIDDFKKNISVTSGNLYINYAGFYRRYSVALSSYSIGRKNVDVTFCTFSLTFTTVDLPFASESTLSSTDIVAQAYTASNITTNTWSAVWSFGGTAKPEPNIRVVFDAVGSVGQLDFKNRTTGDLLSLQNTFSPGDTVFIDAETQQVVLNGQVVDYEGTFPDFDLGNNEIGINNTGVDTYNVLDQQQTLAKNIYNYVADKNYYAQSFVPSSSNVCPYIELYLNESGNTSYNKYPHGNLTVEIRSNSGSSPSSTVLATYTLIKSPINSGYWFKWVKIPFVGLSLTASTTYWIVIYSQDSSVYNCWLWSSDRYSNNYTSGTYKISENNGGSWKVYYSNQDMTFKTYYQTSASSPATYDIKAQYTRKYL